MMSFPFINHHLLRNNVKYRIVTGLRAKELRIPNILRSGVFLWFPVVAVASSSDFKKRVKGLRLGREEAKYL